MFVRVKSTPNSPRQSVQIVASVRDGQTVKQRIVRHIGIAMDDDELVRLKHLAEVVKAKLQAQTQPELFTPEATAQQVIAARPRTGPQALKVDLKQLRETQRVVTGIHAVYGALYEELGLHRLLPPLSLSCLTPGLIPQRHGAPGQSGQQTPQRASVGRRLRRTVAPGAGLPDDGPA